MNKAILSIIILATSLNVSAQVFKTGLLAGISASQIEGDGYGGYNKMGFIVGGFTNTDFSDKWSTQFEIYFINKGSRKNPKPSDGDYDKFYLNLNYVEIPVALRYKHKQFMFEGGLYLAKFLSYHYEDEFGELTQPFTQFPIESFDFGGFIGFNYNYNEHLTFNIRSKSSLLPFRDYQNRDQNIGILNKTFNRGWYILDINFSIRYQFGKES